MQVNTIDINGIPFTLHEEGVDYILRNIRGNEITRHFDPDVFTQKVMSHAVALRPEGQNYDIINLGTPQTLH